MIGASDVEILREVAARMRALAEAAVVEAWAPVEWHPVVAIAVAPILEMAADHAAGQGVGCGSCVQQAVELARAFTTAGLVDVAGDGGRHAGTRNHVVRTGGIGAQELVKADSGDFQYREDRR